MRVQVTLACTETGDRNYITTKTSAQIQSVLNLRNIARV